MRLASSSETDGTNVGHVRSKWRYMPRMTAICYLGELSSPRAPISLPLPPATAKTGHMGKDPHASLVHVCDPSRLLERKEKVAL